MMKDRLQTRVLCVLILVALVLHGCAGAQSKAGEPTQPIKLKVVSSPSVSWGPLFIAEQEGYFTEQGLEIEWVPFNRTSDAVPAFIQGEVDVYAGALSFAFLNAIARGSKLRYVADKGSLDPEGCSYIAAVARLDLLESGALDGAAGVRGRRVSFRAGSNTHYFASKMLAQIGLTMDDIEVIDGLPAAATIEALADGTLDVSLAYEPWIARALQSGNAGVWMRGEQVAPGFQAGTVGFGPSLLDENPEAGRRFMVAYLKAVRQYNQGKTERNLDIMEEATQLDRELLSQSCWPPIRPDAKISVEGMMDFQNWATTNGYIDRVLSEDEFWDASFVEYASQALGESAQ